ncbi:MAG: phospholipase D-like domain-containing protein [Planctomycetota bacterium]|jgi:phosphatidylserine/phosphatidylglycerophosphate/cardiolipin synthase-like enzyme
MSIQPKEKSQCYPRREGNTAIPYIDGVKAMERIFDAILNAKSKVWLTMCFVDICFKIQPFDKSIIKIISEVSQKENMDLRVLAWRSKMTSDEFAGTKDDFELLREHGCKAKIRWDCNELGCHHQKIFIIDEKIAFVGGVNMDETYIDTSAHDRMDPHSTHDLFCEISGPAVRDVIHNYVQRWNEATEREKEYGSFPQDASPDNLELPPEEPTQERTGEIEIQVTRTIPEGAYESIKEGEYGIRESYLNAIDNAKRYVYLENQYFFDKDSHYSVIRALIYAAYRGVKIFIILPGNPDFTKLLSIEFLKEVKRHPNIYVYTLATSYEDNGEGKTKYRYNDIYVHAKLFIVDDEWYSIGSANISYQSLKTDSEMNVAVWDSKSAKKLRQDLWKEHLEYSDSNKIQYDQEVNVDDNIEDAFEQWWFFARANRYYRMTEKKAKNRLLPLDINKYTLFRKGFVDNYVKSKKGLSGILGRLIEKIRKYI